MADEIELVSDGDGLVVAGNRSAVERFLTHAGLLVQAQAFDLGKLSNIFSIGADLARSASGIAEHSALYLKLTPESAKRLKDAGGLMKTKTNGISHAMLGETGKQSLKWLQVQDGPAALLTNPAVLSGLGGLMSQFAQQTEAKELKALLVGIDEKLDDVRRTQRDGLLARMSGAADEIEAAMTIRERGGDPKTLWDKVSGVSETISIVQDEALLALGALADKVDDKSKTGALKKVTQDIESEVVIQLAVLARCFELQDMFSVVELDHVLATAPGNLEGHRLGVADAREKRRDRVLANTSRLMAQMDAAGGIVNANTLLHARAARSVIASLNSTASSIDDFHAPLGIESTRDVLSATPWREAFNDPQQRRTAGKEVAQKAVVGAVVVGGLGLSVFQLVSKNGSKPTA